MTSSSSTFTRILLLSVALGLSSSPAEAFQTQQRQPATPHRLSSTRLHESSDGRRDFLTKGASAAMSALVGGTILGTQPAEASYSAYANREKDWEQRQEKGEIKYSNARELRKQLQEIAPMNDAGSKIFCPNGASAAVSPLMENKCGDRQALPSVYGRTEDSMGNSIPGFGAASATTLRAELNAQAYFRDN